MLPEGRTPMSWDEYEALGPEVRAEYIDIGPSEITFDPATLMG